MRNFVKSHKFSLLLPSSSRENDISNVIDTTFSVEHDAFGQLQVHELKPNGKDIIVTEDNKKEYVKLYVNYRFMQGIEHQFQSLQKGFCELVPLHLLHQFDEKELEVSRADNSGKLLPFLIKFGSIHYLIRKDALLNEILLRFYRSFLCCNYHVM